MTKHLGKDVSLEIRDMKKRKAIGDMHTDFYLLIFMVYNLPFKTITIFPRNLGKGYM